MARKFGQTFCPGFFLVVLLYLFADSRQAKAQFVVTGSNGADGDHPTFAAAMSALQSNTQVGFDAVLSLGSDVSDAITIPAHDWETLLIQPIGQRNISASLNGALVLFDGARRVTLDGVDPDPGAVDRLVINNPNTGTSANAIRFVNDASGNTVRNCSVRGAALPLMTNSPGAVIAFWTGVTTGNDDNLITRCRIGNANLDPNVFTPGDLLPRRAIYSAGSGGTTDLARHNSGNRIVDNWIFNYFASNATSGRGVLLGAGNHEWTIQGNRFFQETPRAFTVSDVVHWIIDVDGSANTHASAGKHVIRENVLGFATGDGTGTHTISGAGGSSDNVFRAISFNMPNSGPRSFISANVIDGIFHSTNVNATSAANSPISLIYINSGQLDVDSNRIGGIDQATATVEFFNSSAASLHAIFNNTGTDLRTRGNRIGGIIYPNSSFYAIRSNGGGTWYCAHNEIGGTMSGIRGTNGQAGRTLAGISAGGGVLIADSNVIRNLVLVMTVNSNSGPRVRGIETTGGGPHILTGNTIHDLGSVKTGTGGSTTDATVNGIYSARAITATSNSIRRLTFNGPGTAASTPNDLPMNATIRGIWTNGTNAHLTAIGNIIDSLHLDLPGPVINKRRYEVHGIRTEGSGVVVVARSNRISRLRVNEGHSVNQSSSQWTADSANTRNGALMGINIAQGLHTTLDSNQVYDLVNTGMANLQVYATGIRVASTGTNVVSRNFVHSLRATGGSGSTALQSHATGIWLVGGSDNTVVNNMVRMGIDPDGTPENIGYRVRGLWVAVPSANPNRTVRLWHNSVYMAGAASASSAQSSHALFSQNNTIRDYRNNILWNARESHTTPGTGQHYVMEVSNATANLTSDFNCLRTTGTNGVRHIARVGTTNYTTLTDWQTTGRDGSSFIDDPVFINANGGVGAVDLHILLPSPANATGVLIPTVLDDIDGEFRAALTPVDIGADALEYDPLPVELSGPWAEAYRSDANGAEEVLLNWTTLSEVGSKRFVVERSSDAFEFRAIGDLPAAGWSMQVIDYAFVDPHPVRGVNYYRLRQEDLDGAWEYSRIVSVHLRDDGDLLLWPNPTDAGVHIRIERPGSAPRVLEVHDAVGRLVKSVPMPGGETSEPLFVDLHDLRSGVYIVSVLDAQGWSIGKGRLVKN